MRMCVSVTEQPPVCAACVACVYCQGAKFAGEICSVGVARRRRRKIWVGAREARESETHHLFCLIRGVNNDAARAASWVSWPRRNTQSLSSRSTFQASSPQHSTNRSIRGRPSPHAPHPPFNGHRAGSSGGGHPAGAWAA